MNGRLIQHPYKGIYKLCKKVYEDFKNEHFNQEITNDANDNANSPEKNQNNKSKSFLLLLTYFAMIFFVFIFFFITSILGLYHSVKCNNTLWTVLNIVGLFTGIPIGTVYYYFVTCSK